MKIETKISLKSFTSWKVGGPADYFISPESVEELIYAQNYAKTQSLPIYFMLLVDGVGEGKIWKGLV